MKLENFPFVQDPIIRSVLAEWIRQADGAGIPASGAIDLRRLKSAVPHLFMLSMEGGSGRLRITVAGAAIEEVFGRSLVGTYLDMLGNPSVNTRVSPYYAAVLTQPCIVHVSGRLYAESRRPAMGERILLPLVEHGKVPSGILGATHVTWLRLGAGLSPPRNQQRLYIPLDGGPPLRQVLTVQEPAVLTQDTPDIEEAR